MRQPPTARRLMGLDDKNDGEVKLHPSHYDFKRHLIERSKYRHDVLLKDIQWLR